MLQFSEHKSTKNEDGTFNIHEVPIFEMGEHRGKNYDQSWMTEALNNFTSLKAEKKFLPRVIIGHTSDKEEKPAVGFLDNLILQGKTVYADLVNLAQKTFDEIKTKAWPSRSVEVNPAKKKFTALALLGGSEPYFQFEPIDVKFEADPDGQWVEFADKTADDKKSIIEAIWSKMLEFFKESKHEVNEMTSQEIQKMIDDSNAKTKAEMEKEFNQKFEEKYQARFKEQFGVDTKTFMENLDKDKKAQFAEKKTSLIDSLKKKLGLAPKIADGYFAALVDAVSGIEDQPIKFAENQEGDIFKLLEKFGEALSDAYEKDTLFVDLKEYAKFGGDEGNPNLGKGAESYVEASEEDLQQYDAKIRKYADAHKVSYDQAAEKVLAGEN